MKKRYILLFVFVIFAVITYLDRNNVSVLSKQITEDLNLTDTQWGLVLGAFSLAYGFFEIPTGMMVDKHGPKWTLIRIVIWWSIFTMLTGFAQGFYFILITRFLFGAGEAGAFPTVSVTISRWFPAIQRGRIQSVVWMGSRLGGALAPFITISLAHTYGWRMVFFIFSGVGMLWVIGWWLWFKDEPKDMAGITAEEVKYIEESRSIKTTVHKLLPFGTIIKSANLWALMGMYHFLLYGAYFYMSWIQKYLEKGRHVAKADLAWMQSLPFIMGMIGCLCGGFVSDYLVKRIGLKLGRRYVGMFGLVMAGVCMLVASSIPENNVAIIFLALGLAFKDFTLPVAWAVATDIGGKNAGTVSGTMGFAGQMGSVIMASAFGYILTSTGGNYEMPVRIIGVLVIIGGLLWLRIDASKPIELEN